MPNHDTEYRCIICDWYTNHIDLMYSHFDTRHGIAKEDDINNLVIRRSCISYFVLGVREEQTQYIGDIKHGIK